MNINKEIRELIKYRRQEFNWSQRHLVERMSDFGVRIVPDTYSRFERGERGLYADEFVALIFALGISQEEIIVLLNSMHEMPRRTDFFTRHRMSHSAFAIAQAERHGRPPKKSS